MDFPLAAILLAALAVLLAPPASAEDGLLDLTAVPSGGGNGGGGGSGGGTYPYCMNVWQAPRTCLCPWPQPADGLICPIPGP